MKTFSAGTFVVVNYTTAGGNFYNYVGRLTDSFDPTEDRVVRLTQDLLTWFDCETPLHVDPAVCTFYTQEDPE